MKKFLRVNKEFIFLLFFFLCFFSYSQQTIIKNGDEWNYFDNGYLENNWVKNQNNIRWKKGISPLGYGDSKIATTLSFGGDEENKEIVKYFRKEIIIDTDAFIGYEIRLLRDDGAVIYVNGQELFRSNMQKATISKYTEAKKTIDGEDEDTYNIHVFDNSIFKKGKNVLLVSVHQVRPDSSDCIFSLELIGHESTSVLEKLLQDKETENSELLGKIKELNLKFDNEKILNQNELLKFSNNSLKMSLFIVSILFLLALIAIYYIIENRKAQKKKFDEIILKKEQNCLEKDREMIYLSSKLLNNKQYFKEIKADLKGISTTDKATVKNIISDIDNLLASEEDWEVLKQHFNAVYDGFYDKLLKLHPELSETDLRHCVFIKLHMQTKEIARILLIDPRSVQTTRYRIKKKMDLDEDVDLRDYLLNI